MHRDGRKDLSPTIFKLNIVESYLHFFHKQFRVQNTYAFKRNQYLILFMHCAPMLWVYRSDWYQSSKVASWTASNDSLENQRLSPRRVRGREQAQNSCLALLTDQGSTAGCWLASFELYCESERHFNLGLTVAIHSFSSGFHFEWREVLKFKYGERHEVVDLDCGWLRRRSQLEISM